MLRRRQVIDLPAHKADMFPHHNSHFASSGGATGSGPHTAQVPIDQPDLLGTALAPILDLDDLYAPNGIQILKVKILTGEASTYSVTFQIRDTTDDASPTFIATVATSGNTEAETTVLTNDTATVGQKIYAVLPSTDVNQAWVVIVFNRI